VNDPASSTPPTPSDPRPDPPVKSFGNMSDAHWSRTRDKSNAEAIDYYRERSHAPGVAEGGGARNMYCMHCDGVIPLGEPIEVCPHCGKELEGDVKRYFNWVEIDRTPRSDLRSLLVPIGIVLVGILGVAVLVWWLVSRGDPA